MYFWFFFQIVLSSLPVGLFNIRLLLPFSFNCSTRFFEKCGILVGSLRLTVIVREGFGKLNTVGTASRRSWFLLEEFMNITSSKCIAHILLFLYRYSVVKPSRLFSRLLITHFLHLFEPFYYIQLCYYIKND